MSILAERSQNHQSFQQTSIHPSPYLICWLGRSSHRRGAEPPSLAVPDWWAARAEIAAVGPTVRPARDSYLSRRRGCGGTIG